MVGIADATDVAKRVYGDFSEKNVTFMAAGIAYNAFVSLAPMLLLLLLVVSVFGGGLEDRLVAVANGWLPRPIADVVVQIFRGSTSAGGASFVGLVVLVWGTFKIFRGLDTAFSEIYETERRNSFVDQLKDAAVVLVGLFFAIVATIGVSAAFTVFSDAIPFVGLLTPLVLVLGLLVAFLPMYYLFPDTDLELDDVVPGALFAAVGWAVMQGLFQVYLAFKDPGSSSFFGSVIVVVTYLYFSGLVLLVGAVLNSVLGGHSSGAPGGVGRHAGGRGDERRESLAGDELAAYLRGLREELTGRYEGMRPAVDSERPERRPVSGEAVELTESSAADGERRRWTVTLQWTSESDGKVADSDERTATGDEQEEDGDASAEDGDAPPRRESPTSQHDD